MPLRCSNVPGRRLPQTGFRTRSTHLIHPARSSLLDDKRALRRRARNRSIVIDGDGLRVRKCHEIDIAVPSDTNQTILRRVNTRVGPAIAKILVGDITIRGVSLC